MSVTTNEDTQVIGALARVFYIDYCTNGNLEPNPAPYVPRWAVSYARLAVDALGYDDEAVDYLKGKVS